MPHRRHWPVLLELANEEDPQAKLKERFSGVDFHEDIVPELPEDWTHREIAEAVDLSRSFVSDVMRGEKTPSLECWESFARLVGSGKTGAH